MTGGRHTRHMRSRKGFTLAETLITIVIMSLAMMLVSSGAVVAHKAMIKAQLKADSQTLLATSVTALNAELVRAAEIKTSASELTVYSEKRGIYMRFYNDNGSFDADGDNAGILVSTSDTADGTVADGVYTYSLVTQETSSSGLYAQIGDISLGGGDGACISYTITVYDEGGDEMEQQQVSVYSAVETADANGDTEKGGD